MADAGASSSSSVAMGPPLVVRVKRELLAACMTCPLCHQLINEATTISECLHTFCRKCIFEKLTDEEVDCCPICHIDLGCVPVEKLRPDHSLQDVRAKIFPLKRRKIGAPDIVPSFPLPARRKERSLSSLVAPRVITRRGLTGRRSKAVARKASALRRLSPIVDRPFKKENIVEDQRSPDNCFKMTQNRRHLKNSSNAQSSNHASECHGQSIHDKTDLWKPLNCLVEAANRTKGLKSQTPFSRANKSNSPASEGNIYNSKVKEEPHKSKIQNDANGKITMLPAKVKPRRLSAIVRRRRDLRNSAQALVDAAGVKCDRRNNPIWISLVASFDEKVYPPLPQIDVSYLRIKNGDLPVHFIKKYLVNKLNLATEAEVEIKCQREAVSSTLTIHNLLDRWLHQRPSHCTQASEKVQVSVGASAKDFVMVLTYSRKVQALEHS